jgi:hypothetical protein
MVTELSSCPDLIRASIPQQSRAFDGFGMDCRVKPGNDDKCNAISAAQS